jgi:uncharacterized membrane protein
MMLLPDWAPNLHPLVIHFPIAWWVAAVMVDLLALAVPRAAWADTVASFLYPAGALSAVVAYLTGRQAAATVLIPGMAHPIVQEHWNWALATTISFAIVALVRLWARFRRPRPQRGIRTALVFAAFVALVCLFETGERGARLVYERGVGVSVSGAVPLKR